MFRHACRLILAVVLAAAAVDATDAPENVRHEWPMFKGNPGFTGFSPDDSVRPPFKLCWAYRTDSDTSGDAGEGVMVGGGVVIVPLIMKGGYLALDVETGDYRWEYKHRDFHYYKVPTYHDGRVFVWASHWGRSTVVALAVKTGKELWTKTLQGKGLVASRVSLPVSDGRLYCPDGGDTRGIVALDVRTGDELWRRPLVAEEADYQVMTPCVAGGTVFFATRDTERKSTKGTITALDAATGAVKWRVESMRATALPVSDGQVVVVAVTTEPGRVSPNPGNYQLDAKTGKILWSVKPTDLPRAPTILPDMILAKPYGNKLFALDRQSGKTLWAFDGKGGSGCSPVIATPSFAYYGTGCSDHGDFEVPQAWRLTDAPRQQGIGWALKAVDLKTGQEAWSFPTGDNVCGTPAIAYGRLYFNSRDGNVYCFEPVKTEAEAVPDAKDKSPNAPAEEVKKLLAEPADKPRPGKDWPMWGGGPERAGLEGIALDPPLSAEWQFDTGGRVLNAAAIRDGRVFIGSDSGKIFALDLAGGAKEWEFQTGGRVRCSAAVVGGLVYCGSDDGRLYALDAASGAKKWAFECGGPVRGSPAAIGGVIVFGADDHHTYALDRKTGRKLWSFRGSYYNHQTPPAIHGDRVYAAQWIDWTRALDLATGEELWKTFAPMTIEALAVHRGKLYLRTPYQFMEYDPASGKRMRMGNTPYGYNSIAFMKNLLVLAGGRSYVCDLDGPDKDPRKIATLQDVRLLDSKQLAGSAGSIATPLALSDNICFAKLAGEVALTDPTGKALWSAKLGGTCHAAPVAADGVLVVGCDDGIVYAFREQK